MIEVGSKVVVTTVPDMCCGAVMRGNKGTVVNIIKTYDQEGYCVGEICILDDNSLHWLDQLQEIV